MTNIELSYRVAKIMDIIMEQGLDDRLLFARHVNTVNNFAELPENDKKIILKAEEYLNSKTK